MTWKDYEGNRGMQAFNSGAQLARQQVIGADYIDPRDYFDRANIPKMFESHFMAGFNAVAPNGGYCVLRGKIVGFSLAGRKMTDYEWMKRSLTNRDVTT